jgi:hypothetical protein
LSTKGLLLQVLAPFFWQGQTQAHVAQRRQVQLIGLQLAACFVLAFGVGVGQ